MTWQHDPKYHEVLEEIDEACSNFREAWDVGNMEACMFHSGGLFALVQKLYALGLKEVEVDK